MRNSAQLGVPVILDWKFGAQMPLWLPTYLTHLAEKHGVPIAMWNIGVAGSTVQEVVHELSKKEGNVPFAFFTDKNRYRIVFPNEQEYVMFLLKWA